MYANAAIQDDLVANDRGDVAASLEQDIVAHAILVATAFRLRDEEALVNTLRRLTASVNKLEIANEDED